MRPNTPASVLHILLLAFVVFSCACVQAETTPEPKPAEKDKSPAPTDTKEDVKKKEDQESKASETVHIVVTANKIPVRTEATGTSIDIISGADKDINKDTHAAEMLRMVPGVTMGIAGRRGSFSAIRIRGGESDHTQVQYDGFKVNRQGGFFSFESLDPVGLDRIEVARGPGSSLHGTDAMTGTINVITKRGEGRPKLTVGAAAGTYHTDIETIDVEGDYKKFAYHVASSRYYRGEASVKNSELQQINYTGRFDYEITEDHYLKVIFRGSDHDKGAFENSSNGMGTAINPPDPNDRIRNNDFLGGFEYHGQILPIWETIVRAGYYQQETTNRIKQPGVSSGFTAASRRFSRLWRPSFEWQNNVTAFENRNVKLIATGGYYLEYESFKNHVSDSNNPIGSRETFGHLNQSIYGQARLELFDRAFITLLGRREENNDFGEFWTGRADASFLIPETDTRVFGSVGNAFRAPTFFDLFDPNFGNAGLTPEENFAYDVGIEQYFWDRKINLKATWFHNQFDALIGFDPNSFRSINVDGAETRGFELAASIQPIRQVSLQANATLMSTKDATGKRLLRRPPHTYTARLVARPLLGLVPDRHAGLTLSFELFHISNRSDRNFASFPSASVRIKSHTRADLTVSYRFLEHFEAYMRAENLTDEKYEEVFSFPADGANILGGLKFSWRF